MWERITPVDEVDPKGASVTAARKPNTILPRLAVRTGPQTCRRTRDLQALIGHCVVPDYSDLRPARRAKNLTLTAAAEHLGVWPSRIGELELGRRPNDDLAHCYREWLTAA